MKKNMGITDRWTRVVMGLALVSALVTSYSDLLLKDYDFNQRGIVFFLILVGRIGSNSKSRASIWTERHESII